jgi:hypothetical protein
MNRRCHPRSGTAFAVVLVSLTIGARAFAHGPEAGGALISPTALVQPARSVTLSNYEGVIMGLSFAPFSRVQLTAVLLPSPVFVTAAGLGVKLLAYDGAATKVALLASGTVIHERGESSDGTHSFYLGGAVVTRCWDGCRSSLSGFVGSGSRDYENQGSGHSYTPITFGANALLRLAGEWSFVLDVTEWGRAGCEGCVDQPLDKLLIAYGLRYSRGRFGATLGLGSAVDLQALDRRPDTLPVLTVAYRFGGQPP